jgi:CoA:oxalate CoA-transferase
MDGGRRPPFTEASRVVPMLSDLTVIEISNSIATSYAGRLLADLGAQVIALEPVQGNRLRHDGNLAPHLDEYLSANKLSAAMDYDAADDARLAASICERADIVLFDRSVPYFDRWLLRECVYKRSDVVLTVVTPWGLESPYSHLCEDELLLFALSGIASVTPEEPENQTVERPMQLYGHQAQFVGGLTAAAASMQGWFATRKSHEALLLDVAVLDALTSMPIISQAAVFAGHPPPKAPSERPQTVPRGFLRCRDGYVYTQGGDDNWRGWAQLLGRPGWDQPPFSEPSGREQRWPELNDAIQAWLEGQSNAAVYRALQEKGITCFPVNSIGQVVANSQVVARDIFGTISGADGGEFRVPRTPFRLLKADFEAVPDVSHALGADLEGVQTMLGMHGSGALAEG